MKILILFSLLFSLLFLSGCATLADILYDTRAVDTGEVVETAFTDADGTVIAAGTPIFEEVHELRPWVRTGMKSTGLIPIPYADVLGLLLGGAGSIGALWLNQKKRTADKVAESSIKAIDVFRDTLDRTEGGAAIDAALTKILRKQQSRLHVADAVGKLLARYATPAKTPIDRS